LPSGLTLNPATGAISGAALQGGIFNFTIRATDANGCIGANPYTLTVLAAGANIPTLDPRSLSILAALLAAMGLYAVSRFRS
ncbi:MAG TPA: Ig domain-containing protein, partial [Thermoanaerobaculia bacterium]|nr:Ig domain-containing protein [Thermoanaerobaculia bacterium]